MFALVVDDDRTTRIFHQVLISSEGIDVHVAEDGHQAVRMITEGNKYDLILMDRDMPTMNGLTATKMLREMGVTSTIVGITSWDRKFEIEDFLAAGADKCLAKPLTIEKLRSIFAEVANVPGQTSGTKN
uniref:Response regulatory domain-containing protein n=1 Tax=Kalanchoe fedtschenkoi TaxID=63787 RepID=A0A7N0U9F9_KALFE